MALGSPESLDYDSRVGSPDGQAIVVADAPPVTLPASSVGPENAAAPKSVQRNSFVLTTGTIVSRGAAFVTTVVVARQFEPAAFAVVLLAQAVAQYLAMLIDFGLTLGGIRTVAVAPERIREAAGAVLSIRLVLGATGVIVVWAATAATGMSSATAAVFVLFAVATMVAGLDLSWVAQGRESTGLRALVLVAGSCLALAIVALAVMVYHDPIVVPIAQLTGSAVMVGVALVIIRRRYGGPRRPDQAVLRSMVAIALPLGLATLLSQVYYNLDLILLGVLRSPHEVAAYGSVYKLVLALLMLAWTYALVVLPRLTRAHAHGATALRTEFGLRLRHLAGVLVPMCLVAAMVAQPLVVAIFGPAYAAGAEPLVVLLFSVPLSAAGSLMLYTLIASGRSWVLPLSTGSGALVNLGLNLFLIPRFGMMGAAVATVAAVAVVLGTAIFLARANLPSPSWLTLGRLVAGCALTAVAVQVSRDLPVVTAVLAGGAAWLGVSVALRYWTPAEWRELRRNVVRLRSGLAQRPTVPGAKI
jgi:O-antigen/teichoic acid export membrane protein